METDSQMRGVSVGSPTAEKNQPTTPPTRKGMATREKLLSAAEKVFGRHGYDAARVADIVKQAGISHGLFYRHYSDKAAIMLDVHERLNSDLRLMSARSGEDQNATTLEKLEHRNIAFFHEYRDNRKLLRVAREAAAANKNAAFRSMWLQMRGRFIDRTHYWLDRLIAKGRIQPVEDTAMIAEGLGALTEQMAYVQIGLAEETPSDDYINRLGKACGLIWHRTIFERDE